MSHHTYSTHTRKKKQVYHTLTIRTEFVYQVSLSMQIIWLSEWKRHFLDHTLSLDVFIYSIKTVKIMRERYRLSVFFPIRKRQNLLIRSKKSIGVLANISMWISHGEPKVITKPHSFLPHQFLSGQSLNYFKSSILLYCF